MKKLNLVLGMLFAGATGLASADSIHVDASGNVGIGTQTPATQMDLIGTSALTGDANITAMYLRNQSTTAGGRIMLGLENNGTTRFSINNTSTTNARWVFSVGNTATFRIAKADTPVVEFEVDVNGNVNAQGTFNTLSDRNSKTNKCLSM